MKISVITICKNMEDAIALTMETVLNQTYEDLEYIIVDGFSKDSTLRKVHMLADEYPEKTIRIFSEDDSGIADAMNRGLFAATGQVVCHLHAGDSFVDKNVISKVMDSYSREKWRWAVAGSVVVDSSGRAHHTYRPAKDKRSLLYKNSIPHQSTFLDMDIFRKNGYFDEDFKQAMDYEFWLRIAFEGDEDYVTLPFDTTYFRAGGTSSNIFELIRYLYRIRKGLRKYNVGTNVLTDIFFLLRVLVFHIYIKTKMKFCDA